MGRSITNMETTNKGFISDGDLYLKVWEVEGEPLRYWVQSDNPLEDPYLVDLGLHRGNGECSCQDFVIRKRINIPEKPLFSEFTICKHIRYAHIYYLRSSLKHICQELNKKPNL